MQVGAIIHFGMPVGTEMYKRCQEIIDKYPEHFPWEHKYKSIPEEVHVAYRKEMGFTFDFSSLIETPMFDENGSVIKGDGLMKSIVDSGMSKEEYDEKVANPEKTIRDFFDMLSNQSNKERDEALRHAKVWNKHYKKYNLKFRPAPHERKYCAY